MTVSGGTGTVAVSPASGSLAPGKSVTVKVTAPGSVAVGQTISLAPGGTTWTVLMGWNSSPGPGSGGGLLGLPGAAGARPLL